MNAESALTTSNTPPESRATENSVENLLAVDDQEGSWLTSNATTGNTNTNLMDEEGGEAMATDDTTIPPTSTASSTAYAFTGSALGGGSTDNLNQKKPPSAAGGSSAAAPGGSEATGDGDKSEDTIFECNICLDTAKDAVVSMCGHLYCWPCLHQWLETRPHRKLCPVCKAAISKEKVIPLYGRNSSKQDDPRNKVPPRPSGHRTEPESQRGFQGFSFGDGFHMSFGIGAFPFGYFTSSLNFGEQRNAPVNYGPTQYDEEQHLSKLFLYLAFLCIVWLLFT